MTKKEKQVDFQYLKIGILDYIGFNPPWRTKGKGFDILRKSIDKFGILTPILVVVVDGAYIVCDGHRRIAAALLLGITKIPARIIEGMTPDEVYQSQFSARIPRGPEIGYLWVEHPDALPKYHLRRYDRFAKMVGIDKAKTLCAEGNGVGPTTIDKLNSFCRFALELPKGRSIDWSGDEEARAFSRLAFSWMREHRGAYRFMLDILTNPTWMSPAKVRSMVEGNMPPQQIMDLRYGDGIESQVVAD